MAEREKGKLTPEKLEKYQKLAAQVGTTKL